MKISESIYEKLTLETLKEQVLKNAYGNQETIIALMDARMLLIWYLIFGLIPWFIDSWIILVGLFVFVAMTTKLAKVAPLVLALFCIGVFSQTGYLLIIAIFFGGDMSTVQPLLVLSLKVMVVSLASITVFSGLDPDKLAKGLVYFGFPDQLAFSISFGYRILPLLLTEFQNILMSLRLRGSSPKSKGIIGGLRMIAYQIKLIMRAFYPLMLNMAKRSRTTVEALEIKGYHYAMQNKAIRRMRIREMKMAKNDFIFMFISVIYILAIVIVSQFIE